MVEGKTITTDHPVAYVSGLFRGSQLNWAALTKEAYAIYMSVKKLAFYLIDADILLKSDHLPLKKFLQKNTLNNKVNNWAMELEAFNIRFEHVGSKANTFDSDTTEHICIIYIIKLTLDERKTLTKISMRNLSQQFPQTSAHFGHNKIRDK